MSTRPGVPPIATMLVAALLAACGPAATPLPIDSPSSSAGAVRPSPASWTAAPSPAASVAESPAPSSFAPDVAFEPGLEIWQVEFGPDGRILVVTQDAKVEQASVVMLDAWGRPLPGWPWTSGDGQGPARAAFGPDGSAYVVVRAQGEEPSRWWQHLERVDADGREMAGFPVELPAVPFCDLAIAPDGAAYVACEDGNADTGEGVATVRAVSPGGELLPGWPVELDGYAQIEGFRPDGAVVLSTGGDETQVTVLARDGRTVDGWPRVVAPRWAHSIGGGVLVDQDGLVRVTTYDFEEGQCGAARRTTLTTLGLDGEPLSGWPVVRDGWASEPAIAPDGSMTIVTGNGAAIRYGLDATVARGWPVRGVDVSLDCGTGSPVLPASRGRTLVVGDLEVTLLEADGRIAAGWPVDPPGRIASECATCTPGPGAPMAPVLDEAGAYVVTTRDDRAWVIGVGLDGSMPRTVRSALGKAGETLEWVRPASNGRLWALLSDWSNERDEGTTRLVPIAFDGALGD